MRRRHFIRVSTGALAAALVPLEGCTRIPEPSPTLTEPASFGAIADEGTLRSVGRAYLATAGREGRQDRLVRALLEDERGDLVGQEDPEALGRFLAAKIRDDYEADRVVVLEGWVLAVTEARQAALFSLVPST